MRASSNEATLGVVLDTKGIPAQVTVGQTRLAVIGYVWEPASELVAVDDTGAVWACPPGGGSRVLMNSSVDALRRFLELFGRFFDATDPAAAAPPPMHLSADQAAEKLAAFRRGEIRPAAPRPPGNRKARIAQLKADLKSVDSAGMQAGWWSVIVEQVDDQIL